MIEIKITIDTALNLLLERMKFELHMLQRQGVIKHGLEFENLSYNELHKLIEASVFDTVFLLPADLITIDTNLVQIITRTVHALAKVLNREELLLYTYEKAKKLIDPITKYFRNSNKESIFSLN